MNRPFVKDSVGWKWNCLHSKTVDRILFIGKIANLAYVITKMAWLLLGVDNKCQSNNAMDNDLLLQGTSLKVCACYN